MTPSCTCCDTASLALSLLPWPWPLYARSCCTDDGRLETGEGAHLRCNTYIWTSLQSRNIFNTSPDVCLSFYDCIYVLCTFHGVFACTFNLLFVINSINQPSLLVHRQWWIDSSNEKYFQIFVWKESSRWVLNGRPIAVCFTKWTWRKSDLRTTNLHRYWLCSRRSWCGRGEGRRQEGGRGTTCCRHSCCCHRVVSRGQVQTDSVLLKVVDDETDSVTRGHYLYDLHANQSVSQSHQPTNQVLGQKPVNQSISWSVSHQLNE